MAGGREYTRTGLIRNPFLWMLFIAGTYFTFFYNVILVPFDKGNPKEALIEITVKGPRDTKFTDLERFMGDRRVFYQGEEINRILPLETFKILFIASVLSFYPTDSVDSQSSLPVAHPEIRVQLRLGIISRQFLARGFEYVADLKGHGALQMVATMEERLFLPQEGSAQETSKSGARN